nr:reverse transcriptase domain-containing protein [Tanacetum cinerariifolium]
IQEEEVATVVEEEGPTWMTPIMKYLKDGTLLDDIKEASKLRIKARQYNNEASHAVDGGKLGQKWEGLSEVTEALGDGAYRLRSMDGAVLSRT